MKRNVRNQRRLNKQTSSSKVNVDDLNKTSKKDKKIKSIIKIKHPHGQKKKIKEYLEQEKDEGDDDENNVSSTLLEESLHAD